MCYCFSALRFAEPRAPPGIGAPDRESFPRVSLTKGFDKGFDSYILCKNSSNFSILHAPYRTTAPYRGPYPVGNRAFPLFPMGTAAVSGRPVRQTAERHAIRSALQSLPVRLYSNSDLRIRITSSTVSTSRSVRLASSSTESSSTLLAVSQPMLLSWSMIH